MQRLPGTGSITDHYLTSYKRAMMAIITAQFGRKSIDGGRDAVKRLMEQGGEIERGRPASAGCAHAVCLWGGRGAHDAAGAAEFPAARRACFARFAATRRVMCKEAPDFKKIQALASGELLEEGEGSGSGKHTDRSASKQSRKVEGGVQGEFLISAGRLAD